jgi:hypothetical protein
MPYAIFDISIKNVWEIGISASSKGNNLNNRVKNFEESLLFSVNRV